MKFLKNMLPWCGLILMIWSCSGQHDSDNDLSPAPFIRSVSTDYDGKLVYGKPVVIEGNNFDPNVNKNRVVYGSGLEMVEYEVLEASENRIVFDAPYVEEATASLHVVSGKRESNMLMVKYDRAKSDSVFLFKDARTKQLRDGVVWSNIYKVWAGDIRSINLVTIELSEKNKLAFGFPKENKLTSVQCLENGALLGVNGSYFNHTHVKINGKVMQQGEDQGHNSFMHDGVFTLDDNMPGIAYVGSNLRASKLTNQNVITCGPLLILNDQYRTMIDNSHNTTTHPRTGVGITEDGRVLLVTVDGRFPEKAVGMPNDMFARLLDAFGAEHALNLDGGGSTTMWIEGEGIVNHPCDERNWEKPVERKVQSMIYLK